MHTGGGLALLRFFTSIAQIDVSVEFLTICIISSVKTVLYAVAALSLSIIIAVPLGVIASGTIISNKAINTTLSACTRLILSILRSIHELIWALLLVSAIGLSPIVAVLALALPYTGILGRIFAEQLQDVPQQPIKVLLHNGATLSKALIYGRIPLAIPNITSYIFYRFECGIRSSSIMSFIGIQGIGYQIQLSLMDLQFGQVWTGLLCLTLMIVLVDAWSSKVRRIMVN